MDRGGFLISWHLVEPEVTVRKSTHTVRGISDKTEEETVSTDRISQRVHSSLKVHKFSPEKFSYTSYESRPVVAWPRFSVVARKMPLQSRYIYDLITSSPEKFAKTSISSSSTGRETCLGDS